MSTIDARASNNRAPSINDEDSQNRYKPIR
jgi:hypothetical protein